MDDIVRWILDNQRHYRTQAAQARAFEQHFGAGLGPAYRAALGEAQRLTRGRAAVERGPGMQRLDTALGAGRQAPGTEARIPVVYAIQDQHGHIVTRRADVVVDATSRLWQVRAEVNVRGVDLAGQSGFDLIDIVYLVGPYYGPGQYPALEL